MADSRSSQSENFPKAEMDRFRHILGYLNFSEGKPDSVFQTHLNELSVHYADGNDWPKLKTHLLQALEELEKNTEAFSNSDQARRTIEIAFDDLLPSYREYHQDLLFHVREEMFHQPFFLARLFEAVLAQDGPWEETDRIVKGALQNLNNFLGYRPVAVLENGRKMQPYAHEQFCPIPLYIRDAGVATGRA